MPSKKDFDDEYVARLLAEDAKKSSANYAAKGVSALLPQKMTSNAPKPNTRFLSNLVRDADSHNAALKRKEEVEARMRLKGMRKDKGRKHVFDMHNGDDRPKKRRLSEDNKSSSQKREEPRSKHSGHAKRASEPQQNPEDDGQRNHGDKHSKKRRRRHKRRDTDHQPQHIASTRSVNSEAHSKLNLKAKKSATDLDSDPLEDIVGPMPLQREEEPPHVRGRGAARSRSNIDRHFAKDYDPSQDVRIDTDSAEDSDEWGLALEAVRDRAMWKQKQSQRLRDAGWHDSQIQNWSKGALQRRGDESEVKWVKKGEKRAWDVGKHSPT